MPPADSNPGLPKPTAEGTLAKTPLPHLLVYAREKELTGTFAVESSSGKSVTFVTVQGLPLKARTSETVVYLGRALVELRILGEDVYLESLPDFLQGTELHGLRLVRECLITPEELELGLRTQLGRQLASIAGLPDDATFKFYDGVDALASYGGDDYVGIDPYPVVWSCIRASPPWEHIKAALARIGSTSIALSPGAKLAGFSFDKAERAVVDRLRLRPWSLPELITMSGMAPSQLHPLAYCLLITRQVDVARKPEAAGPRPAHARPPVEDDASSRSPPLVTSEIRPAVVLPAGKSVARVQLARVARPRAAVEDARGPHIGVRSEGDDGTSYGVAQPRRRAGKTPSIRPSAKSTRPPAKSTRPPAKSTRPPAKSTRPPAPKPSTSMRPRPAKSMKPPPPKSPAPVAPAGEQEAEAKRTRSKSIGPRRPPRG